MFLGAAFFAGGVAGMAGGAFLGALAPTLLPLSTGMPVGFTTMGSASMVLAQKKQMEVNSMQNPPFKIWKYLKERKKY